VGSVIKKLEPCPAASRFHRWRWELAALAIALGGVAVRCIPWRYIFSTGRVVLPGMDPYYHLRRAGMLVDSFPVFLTFDPFISFPSGAHIPWPPGFDLLVALPGLLGGGKGVLAGWGAILMPLLGGLSVYLTYRLARRVFDPATGLVAAGFMALMYGAVSFSFVGRVDHHGLVAPVVLGMYLALLAALRSRTKSGAVKWSLLCGLLTAFSVGSWIISPPLYFLPIPVVLFILGWTSNDLNVRRVAWYCLGSSFMLVSATVLLLPDLESRLFTLYQPSLFTLSFYGFAAVFVIAFFYSRRICLSIWALMIGLIVLLAAIVPEFRSLLHEAIGVATGRDPSYLIARESSRIFFEDQLFSLGHTAALYTNLFLLAPVLVLVFLWCQVRVRHKHPGRVLLAVFFPFGLILLLFQERFGEYAAPAVAILFAWSLVAGARMYWSFFRMATARARAVIWGVLLGTAVLAALVPLVTSLVYSARTDLVVYQRVLMEFGEELAVNTPPVMDHNGRPSYGILTSWNETHPLLYSAGRPVMTSSFGTLEALRGNRAGFRLLLTDDEETAYRELAEKRIRFVVVTQIFSQVTAMSVMAEMPQPLMQVETSVHGEGYARHYRQLPAFEECLHTRMLISDGTIMKVGEQEHKALAHFRLYLESSSTIGLYGLRIPLIKAFEVVKGGRLAGKAPAGELIRLRLSVLTNTGRKFTYARRTEAKSDGHFEFIVPYPTEPWDSPTRTVGPYRIRVADRVYHVGVSDEDVRMGRTVLVQ